MTDIEEREAPKTKVPHFNIGVTVESLQDTEERLQTLGHRDEIATRAFQSYYLPGQEFMRPEQDGSETRVVRSLLDPEEYVRRVEGNSGFARLQETAREDQESLNAAWDTDWGGPLMMTSIEIILGDTETPQNCYRYRLLAIRSGQDKKLALVVRLNIEHEKRAEVGRPLMGDLSQLETDEQKGLSVGKEGLHPNLAFGGRTGRLVAHQRSPQGMTQFGEYGEIKVDPEKDHLWVVVADADAVARLREENLAKQGLV